MLWNEAIEAIVPPPEVDLKVKGRKRHIEEKNSSSKKSKIAENEAAYAATSSAAAAAAAVEDSEQFVAEASTGATVYQIYHRAFE
jgi:cysteine synthase